jgi:acyl dehydratase
MPTINELAESIGQEMVSTWFEMGQNRIDAFAETTEDWQFIHVDAEAASQTPFGGTIAHGFLTLSLMSAMANDVMPVPEGVGMAVNYGLDRLRFLSPVPSGSRVRGRFKLLSVEDKGGGRWLIRHEASVEIEGVEKPALAAEWLGMHFMAAKA